MSNLSGGGRFKYEEIPGYPELSALLISASRLWEGINLGLVNLLFCPVAAVLVSIG